VYVIELQADIKIAVINIRMYLIFILIGLLKEFIAKL